MKSAIPMTNDVAELIGKNAELVDNRSLLLDKFVFHKSWPPGNIKHDDAIRWSFMRIAEGATIVLNKQANELEYRAKGKNVKNENHGYMPKVKWETKELNDIRSKHTRRFIRLFKSTGNKASVTIARLESRLAINLADGLIQNAGICLDRLFGLPFIPGSAVKGVSRAFALEEIKMASGNERTRLFSIFCRVFGTSENDFKERGELSDFVHLLNNLPNTRKGAVAFLPAYPLDNVKIVVDLTNVHYPDYYRTGNEKDLAEEKPRPNPFPAIEAGTSFAFCLYLNGLDLDTELLKYAEQWLKKALTVHGIGAKTSSGYGWFSIDPDALKKYEEEEAKELKREEEEKIKQQEEQRRKQQEKERIEKMSPEERAAEELWLTLGEEQFKGKLSEIDKLDASTQKAILILCLTHGQEVWKEDFNEYLKLKDNPKKQAKSKAYNRAQKVIATAQKHGVKLS